MQENIARNIKYCLTAVAFALGLMANSISMPMTMITTFDMIMKDSEARSGLELTTGFMMTDSIMGTTIQPLAITLPYCLLDSLH